MPIACLFLLVTFVALLALIWSRPDSFRVTRTARMKATPAVIFEQVNDFRKWGDWSPWATLDPAAKITFDGPQSGAGSIFAWDGNKNVGAGSMAITHSHPYDVILIRLTFTRPFKGTNNVEFTFTPEGDETMVKWEVSGPNNFFGKAMSLVFDCEKMIGPMYEKGLTNIKNIVEKP